MRQTRRKRNARKAESEIFERSAQPKKQNDKNVADTKMMKTKQQQINRKKERNTKMKWM